MTVMLRNFWPGGKPVILVTANKSHAGKGTVIDFATGLSKSIAIPYQSEDWALEHGIADVLEHTPDVAVVNIDNARLGKRDKLIASACLERALTDPEPFFFSTHRLIRIPNYIVFAATTNLGMFSEDMMNRGLLTNIESFGDVASRKSPIGNPKHEFLPENEAQIDAELRGMIERWKAAGMPLDLDVRHPFALWARTIGGILKVNGFTDFLANHGQRKTADDPLRRALGLLGLHRHGEEHWLPSPEWVKLAVDLGLSKVVIPEADRENETSRARGMGAVLHAHSEETFEVESDTEKLTLRLEQRRGAGVAHRTTAGVLWPSTQRCYLRLICLKTCLRLPPVHRSILRRMSMSKSTNEAERSSFTFAIGWICWRRSASTGRRRAVPLSC